jgi:hypothetical protein
VLKVKVQPESVTGSIQPKKEITAPHAPVPAQAAAALSSQHRSSDKAGGASSGRPSSTKPAPGASRAAGAGGWQLVPLR